MNFAWTTGSTPKTNNIVILAKARIQFLFYIESNLHCYHLTGNMIVAEYLDLTALLYYCIHYPLLIM